MNATRPPTAAELGIGMDPALPDERRATRQNWTLAPHNRWSFQRVSCFTATGRIARAPEPSALPRREVDLGSLEFEDTTGRRRSVDAMLTSTWCDGFLVMHRGEILFERYMNGMRPDTLHLAMSCSKSMTSTMAAILIANGTLDPSRPLTDWLPELAGGGMAGATLQHALDMQVGVRFSEDYDDLEADWRRCEVATGWRDPEPDYAGPRDMVGYAASLTEREAEHGERFHYQSILTDVIGVALERASGRPFADLFAEHVWHPIGAEHDLVSIVDSAGTFVFEGGFNVCLRDFARFAWLIAQRGRWGERQLVPAGWIDACRHPEPALIETFARGEYAAAIPGGAYHDQWWVWSPGRGVLLALGIHGQGLYIDPDRECVVANFSSQPAPVDVPLVIDRVLASEAIAEALCEAG